MPTENNRIYTPYLYGEEVPISTYPDDTTYTTDVQYNVYECERPYKALYGKTSLWYYRHIGLDMVGKLHATLYAVETATVVEAVYWGNPTGKWGSKSSGTYVALSINGCRGHEVVAVYKHLSELNVSKGDVPSKGSPVGLQGTTGNSTGEHLHFELWIDGRLVDPVPYLEGRKSFIIADPEPEVTGVEIAVIARYRYIDGGTQNIRAEASSSSADVGDIANLQEFDVDFMKDNEGYTWGHIPNVGWTALYSGATAWCEPVVINDGSVEIAELNGIIIEKDAEISMLNTKIDNAKIALG